MFLFFLRCIFPIVFDRRCSRHPCWTLGWTSSSLRPQNSLFVLATSAPVKLASLAEELDHPEPQRSSQWLVVQVREPSGKASKGPAHPALGAGRSVHQNLENWMASGSSVPLIDGLYHCNTWLQIKVRFEIWYWHHSFLIIMSFINFDFI